MTIDIEKLKVDESLWPEGATHFIPATIEGCSDVFWRIENDRGVEAWAVHEGELHHYPDPLWSASSDLLRATPRPEPRQVDWDGDTWPIPVGAEVEFQVEPLTQFYVVEVIAHYDGSMVFIAGDDYPHGQYDGCSHPECFRPIRTKEQREREELAVLLCQHGTPQDLADAILSHYNLEPKK